jgi:hypothetical protein
MSALHPNWRWTNEGFKYQDVDVYVMYAAVSAKRDVGIPTVTYHGSKASSFTPWSICCEAVPTDGKNDPVLVDAVSRETRDLAEANGDGRIDTRHSSSPRKSSCVEKPVRFSRPRGLRLFDAAL